jgi:hypothetical protein
MTARRLRDLRRLLESVAEPFGATVIVEHTSGNHLRGTFAIGTRQAFIIASWSPSDWRAGRQIEANARRMLRELTGGADLKVAIAQCETGRGAP